MKRLLAFLLATLCATPALADISSVPTRLATGTVATGTAAVISGASSANVAFGGGTTVFLIVAESGGGAVTVSSASDTAGNTYTCQATAPANTVRTAVCYSVITNSITTSTTFTQTWSGTAGAKALIVEYVTGASATPVGAYGAGAINTNSTPSIGPSGTLTMPPNQLAFGIVGWSVATGSVSAEGGSGTWTTTGADVSLSNVVHLHVAYQFLNATGTITYSPTLSGSLTWAINYATYVAAASGGCTGSPFLLLHVGKC